MSNSWESTANTGLAPYQAFLHHSLQDMSIDKGMSMMIASLPPMTCFDTMAWRCHVKQKQEACWNDLAQNWTGVLWRAGDWTEALNLST